MTNTNYKNEKIKRNFFEEMMGGEGFSKKSLNSLAGVIAIWEIFSSQDDFSNFNKSRAVTFVEWLKNKESKTRSRRLGLVTQNNYLRYLRKFFKWLSDEPDYKNKISKGDIKYLRLSREEERIATSGTTRPVPTLEDIKRIIEHIEIKNEVDTRDRAMISFALITGMRISALVSLKMKNFDDQTMKICQNPRDGVKTKNTKLIFSTFIPIEWDEPEKYFKEWYAHLKSKGFGPYDPIFPATFNQLGDNKDQIDLSVGKNFWKSGNSARKVFENRCKDAGVHYFNPHSFRHSIVNIISKVELTRAEEKAVSLCLGHENIGTTFGPHGYGSMSNEDALKIVRKIKIKQGNNNHNLSIREALGVIVDYIDNKEI
jgi:integrase